MSVALQDFLTNPDIHYYDLHELHNGEIVEASPRATSTSTFRSGWKRCFDR